MENENAAVITELKELYLFLRKLYYDQKEKEKILLTTKVETKLIYLNEFFEKEGIDPLKNQPPNDLNK